MKPKTVFAVLLIGAAAVADALLSTALMVLSVVLLCRGRFLEAAAIGCWWELLLLVKLKGRAS